MKLVEMMICALLASSQAETNKPWQLVHETAEINVWARSMENSNLHEVKAEMVMHLPAQQIWEVLADVEHYHEFMPYVVETKTFNPKDQPHHYEYLRLSPPFISQRDYTLQVQLHEDPNTGVYRRSWSIANQQGPAKRPDAIRLQVCNGSWTLKAMDANRTHVTYWIHTDPGGSVPQWITNRANRYSVSQLLEAVRQRASEPKL